jgi:hypothetical protein
VIEEAQTERRRLLDLGADHMAGLWYELGYPQFYASTRHVQGHEIVVIACNGEMAKRILEAAERRTKARVTDEDDQISN